VKRAAAVALLSLIAMFCSASDTIRATAGTPLRFSAPGLTAAYTLDPDCADVTRDGKNAIIVGKRSCLTHLVTVADGVPSEYVLIVVRPTAQVAQFREQQLRARGLQQAGSISSSYSSDPNQIETAIEMNRAEGDHAANISVTVDNGYGYGALTRRTTVPRASLQFTSPSSSVTILDSEVKDSPLTFEGVRLRGLHVDTKTWFVHGGIASLTNFRQQLYEQDPDRAVEAGYRFFLSKNLSLTPSVEWIRASEQYVAGRSGLISAMKLEYARAKGIHFRVQSGVSDKRGLGVASDLDFLGKDDRIQASVRSTPIDFPGLSMSRSRGFQASGSWTRWLTERWGLDTSGTRNVYSLSDGTSQSNSNWDARLQWRVRHVSLNGGYAGSSLSRRNGAALTSTAVPASASFESRYFGNSFQYRFSRNGITDSGSHSMRDTTRIKILSLTLTSYVSRQTQAPTLDYVLVNLPWLRDALLTSGASVSTPEEVQEFINSHADLIAGGYLRDLSLNVSPVHRQVGATASWVSRKNFVAARFEWRTDDDARLTGRVISQYEFGSLTFRLGRSTDFIASGSYISTQLGNTRYHQPTYNFGLRRKFGAVPAFVNRFQDHASIHGIVFSDANGRGEYDKLSKGIPGVVVILDGYRKVQTNRMGYYAFSSVPAGKHSVEIQYNSEEPFLFTTAPSVPTTENTTVNFGIGEQKTRLFGTVFNDAGMPIANVRVRVSGAESHELTTGQEGSFSLVLAKAGDYRVALDPESLPPAYSLEGLKPQQVQVKRGHPAQFDFTVQALRSISGRVSCGDNGSGSDLRLIGTKLYAQKIDVDQSGNFVARGLSAGDFQLVLKCKSSEARRQVEVGTDPAAISGIDLRGEMTLRTAKQEDAMAVGAVWCEPLSLLTGNFSGNLLLN
jgi:hypothetical protein